MALDTFFQPMGAEGMEVATILGPIYDFLNDSVILSWVREWVIPVAGFVVRPFVPDDVEQFLLF